MSFDGLEQVREVPLATLETPYGYPSDAIVTGRLPTGDGEGVELLFLPRHGRGHNLSPSRVNYRANICALKRLGATHVVSVSAVGSMREDIAPGDVVVVDQFIDLTKQRAASFFDDGAVAHVSFAQPVCADLANAVASSVERAAAERHQAHPPRQAGGPTSRVFRKGTYVCIEGPQFSTRAESLLYRSWGVSVIGMTAMPEAKLAREAQLPYCTMALATDYDCWHEGEEAVTADAVVAVMRRNVALARDSLRILAGILPDPRNSPAVNALAGAVMTAPDRIPSETGARARLAWLMNG